MTANRALLLVAGYPGTGKTHFCEYVRTRCPDLRPVSIDTIKEAAFDRRGFSGTTEKKLVEEEALNEYFKEIEDAMRSGASIISEHPFSEKQRPRLRSLASTHRYQPVTIRFVADLPVLFERQRQRDLDTSRHPGHLLTTYRNGDRPPPEGRASGLLTWNEFERRCRTRGYGEFQLGPLVEVDTTEFAGVDYAKVLEKVEAALNGLQIERRELR